MKRFALALGAVALAASVNGQSITNLTQGTIAGNSGLWSGYDATNDRLIVGDFGNPPIFDVVDPSDFSDVGDVSTSGPTYGALGGFGGGVGSDGFIAALDHNEVGDASELGLIGWDDLNDATPTLITDVPTANAALDGALFPRFITVIGTGTDRSLILASPSATADDITSAMYIYRTSDGLNWQPTTRVNEHNSADPSPEFGGQRGSAAGIGSGSNEFPQWIAGSNTDATAAGVTLYEWDGGTGYDYVTVMAPTSTDSSALCTGIAIDDGGGTEEPVAIVLGQHATGSAIYMYSLTTQTEIATLVFNATGGSEVATGGALSVDAANNVLYFSIPNGTDATLGKADYDPGALSAANVQGWDLY